MIDLSFQPPLDRSNNDDRRQWRKQGVAVSRGQQDASKALRMLGAATGSGTASAVTERFISGCP